MMRKKIRMRMTTQVSLMMLSSMFLMTKEREQERNRLAFF
jgi:hypothetical protein